MTDEELKELVAANSRAISQLQEGQQLLQEGQRQLQEQILASRVEMDRLMTAVQRTVDRTSRDLGRLGNRFGDYTEGLCFPALDRILREQFGMTQVGRQVRSNRNGDNLELDMFGHANDRIHQAYVAEIKTSLRQDAIDQILKHLRVFPEFFPHHRGKDLYGILAAINAPPEEQKKVWKEGLYLVLVSDQSFQLCQPEGFRPRAFPND